MRSIDDVGSFLEFLTEMKTAALTRGEFLTVAEPKAGNVTRGRVQLHGVNPEGPGFRVMRDSGQLLAVSDGGTLAALDLASGRLSIDLGAIRQLEQLIQVTHAMVGHPEALSARREWDAPAVGRLSLLDRNALFAALAARMIIAKAPAAPVGAVAWVDLDNLKYINDRMGHRVGDLVIEAHAERLQRVAGDAVVARVGGDEFVLLFDNVTPVQAAEILAGASRDAMGPVVTDVGEIPVTFSAGVTDLSGRTADEVLSRADATLYQAKRAGRDQIRVYGDSTAAFVGERRDLFGTVDALRTRNDQLAQEARTDALTDIPNRRALDETFAARDLTRPSGQVDHVLFLDLDRFSSFNHTQGQEAGDDALRAVAGLLSENLRDGDTCFRRGGEEFVVLLPSTNRAAAHAVAERARSAVEAAGISHGGHPDCPVLTLTVAVGAISGRYTDFSAVVERAAKATFLSKESGIRNCVVTMDDVD